MLQPSVSLVGADAVRLMLKELGTVGPRVAVRALNKTAANVRSEAVRRIRAVRGLPARTVRETLRIRRAQRHTLYAEVVASGRPVPLRDYGARTGKRGVSVAVNPTRGRRGPVRKHGNTAFTVERIGGHVFVRKGPGRLPIEKLFGPSIPSTLIRREIIAALRTVAGEAWIKRAQEELAFELRRFRR